MEKKFNNEFGFGLIGRSQYNTNEPKYSDYLKEHGIYIEQYKKENIITKIINKILNR